MVNDKPVRVAVYARVSTEHEAQVLALDNQLEWYTDIIEKNPNYIEVGSGAPYRLTSGSKFSIFFETVTDFTDTNPVNTKAKNHTDDFCLVEVDDIVAINLIITEHIAYAEYRALCTRAFLTKLNSFRLSATFILL